MTNLGSIMHRSSDEAPKIQGGSFDRGYYSICRLLQDSCVEVYEPRLDLSPVVSWDSALVLCEAKPQRPKPVMSDFIRLRFIYESQRSSHVLHQRIKPISHTVRFTVSTDGQLPNFLCRSPFTIFVPEDLMFNAAGLLFLFSLCLGSVILGDRSYSFLFMLPTYVDRPVPQLEVAHACFHHWTNRPEDFLDVLE